MSEEFRNNQNQNQEGSQNGLDQDSGSFYHYSYPKNQNSPEPQSGKDPKKDPSFKKILARAAAIALVVGVVGGGAFEVSRYAANKTVKESTVQAAEGEEETGEKETEVAKAADSKAADSKATMTNLSSTTVTEEGDMSVKDVAAYAMPGMVAITNMGVQEVQEYFFGRTYQTQQQVESTGSGVIIDENEEELLIATNNHVVSGADTLTVCFTVDAEDSDDLTVAATIKGTDPNHDLAIISVKLSDISDDVKSKIRIMEIGSSDNLALGEQVVAIGNALGYGQSVTSGYVSALNREVTVDNVTNNLIQTDAAINPGNSGGALLNMKGQLIGINSVKAAATGVEGMGYAIPIDTAMPIFDELKSIEAREIVDEDKQGYMGIKPADVTEEARQIYNIPAGAFVYEVISGSAAEDAGLKKGDIITKMDSVIISSKDDLFDRMNYYAAGDQVVLTIQRAEGGEYVEQEITVTLAEKPEDVKNQQKASNGSGSNGSNGSQGQWYGGSQDDGSQEEETEEDPFSQLFPEYFQKNR